MYNFDIFDLIDLKYKSILTQIKKFLKFVWKNLIYFYFQLFSEIFF